MNLEADIYIKEVHYKTIHLGEKLGREESIHLEIPSSDFHATEKILSPEILSIESIIKENVHSIRKSINDNVTLADVIESGDISIRLKDDSGRYYKMIQILDMNLGVYPPNIDFFECDADMEDFGYYLLCTIEPSPSNSVIILSFRKIPDPHTMEKVKEYRLTRDLRLLDVGSGICLNIKSLEPDTESEEDSFEIGQLMILERLLSKIQRNRISKKNRKRYYILGEKIFKGLQRN